MSQNVKYRSPEFFYFEIYRCTGKVVVKIYQKKHNQEKEMKKSNWNKCSSKSNKKKSGKCNIKHKALTWC